MAIHAMPDNMVQSVFLVSIAVRVATMPANSLTFPREIKTFPDCMNNSGTIRADRMAGGTYFKSLFAQEGMSQTPKRNMKDARVR